MPMHEATMIVFTRSGERIRETLAAGEVFLILAKGVRPYTVRPDDAPGTYDIDVSAIAGNANFPIGLVVIPEAHVFAFMDLSDEAISGLLDEAIITFEAKRMWN